MFTIDIEGPVFAVLVLIKGNTVDFIHIQAVFGIVALDQTLFDQSFADGSGIAVLLTTRGWIVDFGVEVFPALIAFFSTPAPVSGATMAGQMGNDEDLATQLVVWTNMGSIVTMFLTACILMATGFIAT